MLEFSLLRGGLIDRALRKAGLVEPASRLALAAAIFALVGWGPMALLALAQGRAVGGPGMLLHDFQAYARFWVGVPLLVLADGVVGGRLSAALRYLFDAGVVTADNRVVVDRALERTARLRDSIWEVMVILVAYLAVFAEYKVSVSQLGPAWRTLPGAGPGTLSLAAWWYLLVGAPIFYVLLFRWLWRLGLWSLLLLQLARASLRVAPTHPDAAGGLGPLASAHGSFAIIILAMGSVLAAGIDNQATRTAGRITDFKVEMLVFVVLAPSIFLAPLALFAPYLVRTRRALLDTYGAKAASYSSRFEQRWVHGADPIPLEIADISTNADFGASFGRVEKMRALLFLDRRVWLPLVIAAALPMILVLTRQIPLLDILKQLKGVAL
jgi:hypothetical protein